MMQDEQFNGTVRVGRHVHVQPRIISPSSSSSQKTRITQGEEIRANKPRKIRSRKKTTACLSGAAGCGPV
jgi:hypothetical protein